MTTERLQNLTQLIRERRTNLGYSQEYMAAKMGLAQNTYSKIEKGNVKLTVERLISICNLLNLDLAATLSPTILAKAS